MTLHDFYFKTVNEKPHLADCKWKIVDKHTRKNLCGDFATCDYLTCASCEEKSVWSSAVNTTKNGVVYVRVTVYDPIKFPTKPKEEPAAEETAPVQPAEQAQEAETVVESAEAPAETEEIYGSLVEHIRTDLSAAGFHPIINNLSQKSKWDVWNVRPDEYLSSCVVPLVRCDENHHVLDTVYLKVDTPEEVKTLMSAAAVGNRRRWPKYNKQYRRETVQRAADIIEKYYI